MSIKESALTAITSIAQSDFIRAVTSAGASRRITLANLAKAIVESYTGSSLAGSSQSVKSAIDSLNSNTHLTLTRTEQDHVNATSFGRLSAEKKGNMLTLFINLEAVWASGFSGFEKIGTISGWSALGTSYINIPSQSDGSKILVLYVNTSGDIHIYSATSYSGSPFFRGTLTTPCA